MVRFSAVVRQRELQRRGRNPFVDVPATVSGELKPFATAGRIRVSGRLGHAGFNATLMPVAGGGHVLYLPGGLRSATGIKLGDTVSIHLEPLGSSAAKLPEDLDAGLRSNPGARAAWDGLAASHRRELIRYLEDARTPRNRGRRVEIIVAQLTGTEILPPGQRAGRDLWTCPDCGRQFVTPNMYHSCNDHSLGEPFRGKPEPIRNLFDLVLAAVQAFGPVTLVPYADRVAFMVRVRFAGARPRTRWIDVDFWLTHRIESARLHKVETLSPYTHIHTVRVTEPSDVDGQLTAWLREAYAVGQQEHLHGPTAQESTT